MELDLLHVRAVLSSDRDLRRLGWLLRYKKLPESHRVLLGRIGTRVRAKFFGEWAQPGEREQIRVLFNLHRGAKARIKVTT